MFLYTSYFTYNCKHKICKCYLSFETYFNRRYGPHGHACIFIPHMQPIAALQGLDPSRFLRPTRPQLPLSHIQSLSVRSSTDENVSSVAVVRDGMLGYLEQTYSVVNSLNSYLCTVSLSNCFDLFAKTNYRYRMINKPL